MLNNYKVVPDDILRQAPRSDADGQYSNFNGQDIQQKSLTPTEEASESVLNLNRVYFPFHATKTEVLQQLLDGVVRFPVFDLSVSLLVDVSQALKDFRREKVLLNGVSFTPEIASVDNNDTFAISLQNLAKILCRMSPMPGVCTSDYSNRISNSILQKSCRTGCGADSFFMVHKIFNIHNSLVTQNISDSDPPIEIDVFISEGCIFSHIECRNSYGIIDLTDLEEDSPAPWIYIDTFVREETNFTTGETHRLLEILAPGCKQPRHINQNQKQHHRRSHSTNELTTEMCFSSMKN